MKSRMFVGGLIVGVVGGLLLVVGALANPAQAAFSFLVAYAYWLAIALGALILVMVHHAAGAYWFTVLRRLAEFIAATMPLFAVLFLVVLFSSEQLYVWARPAAAVDPHLWHELHAKRGWLSIGFFVIRAALYLLVWLVFAELILRRSVLLKSARVTSLRAIGAGGLPAVALALTFSAFDWYMSTDPMWYSTIYGVYYFAAGFSSSLAALAIVAFFVQRHAVTPLPLKPDHYHGVGKLMFAFVIFWAYMAYSQLHIIWMGDIPEESHWYMVRMANGYDSLGWLLIFGRFAVPFFALLSWRLKRQPAWLAIVGAWILIVHYVDMYWLLMPVLHPDGLQPSWMDLVALVGVGGLMLGFGLWRARAYDLMPVGDPKLAPSLEYHSP